MTEYTVSPKQVLLMVTLLAAVGVMTSIFVPRDTVATPDSVMRPSVPYTLPSMAGPQSSPRPAIDDIQVSTDPHAGLTLLGTLECGNYVVRMYAVEDGVLYSIYDRDGHELAILMSAEEAEAWFGDIHLTDLIADPAFGRAQRFDDHGH